MEFGVEDDERGGEADTRCWRVPPAVVVEPVIVCASVVWPLVAFESVSLSPP